jgi:hypothetical protein
MDFPPTAVSDKPNSNIVCLCKVKLGLPVNKFPDQVEKKILELMIKDGIPGVNTPLSLPPSFPLHHYPPPTTQLHFLAVYPKIFACNKMLNTTIVLIVCMF